MMLNLLKKHGISGGKAFTSQAAGKAGVSRSSLTRLVKTGEVNHVGRNQFIIASEIPDLSTLDFDLAFKHFGARSAVWGLSALFYYQIFDRAPHQTWVIVPAETKTKLRQFKLYRTSHWTKKGIIKLKSFQITNIERTIIEALEYPKIFGSDVGAIAAKNAFEQSLTTPAKIYDMAKKLGKENVILKYWSFLQVINEQP